MYFCYSYEDMIQSASQIVIFYNRNKYLEEAGLREKHNYNLYINIY